jgi:hypothetical protein
MPSRRELLAAVLVLGIGAAWVGGAGRVMAQIQSAGSGSDYAPPEYILPLPLYNTRPEDGGFFATTYFEMFRQTNPVSSPWFCGAGLVLQELHVSDPMFPPLPYLPALWPMKQNHLESWVDLTSAVPRQQEHRETVSFDVRIVRVPASLHERLKETFPLDGNRPIQCSEREVHALLEAVQSDPNASIVSSPVLRTLPGQTGTVEIGQHEKFLTGVRMVSKEGKPAFEPVHTEIPTTFQLTVKGTPKNEGKSVEVELTVNAARIERVETIPLKLPMGEKCEESTQAVQCPHVARNTLARTVTLPSDATVVLPGWWEEGETPEVPPPALGKVPVPNGLLVGTPKESQRVIVLLTARTVR